MIISSFKVCPIFYACNLNGFKALPKPIESTSLMPCQFQAVQLNDLRLSLECQPPQDGLPIAIYGRQILGRDMVVLKLQLTVSATMVWAAAACLDSLLDNAIN